MPTQPDFLQFLAYLFGYIFVQDELPLENNTSEVTAFKKKYTKVLKAHRSKGIDKIMQFAIFVR